MMALSCRVWVFNLNNVQIPVAHLMHNHAERWPDATRTIQLAVSKVNCEYGRRLVLMVWFRS